MLIYFVIDLSQTKCLPRSSSKSPKLLSPSPSQLKERTWISLVLGHTLCMYAFAATHVLTIRLKISIESVEQSVKPTITFNKILFLKSWKHCSYPVMTFDIFRWSCEYFKKHPTYIFLRSKNSFLTIMQIKIWTYKSV